MAGHHKSAGSLLATGCVLMARVRGSWRGVDSAGVSVRAGSVAVADGVLKSHCRAARFAFNHTLDVVKKHLDQREVNALPAVPARRRKTGPLLRKKNMPEMPTMQKITLPLTAVRACPLGPLPHPTRRAYATARTEAASGVVDPRSSRTASKRASPSTDVCRLSTGCVNRRCRCPPVDRPGRRAEPHARAGPCTPPTWRCSPRPGPCDLLYTGCGPGTRGPRRRPLIGDILPRNAQPYVDRGPATTFAVAETNPRCAIALLLPTVATWSNRESTTSIAGCGRCTP
jgi:hypothetical protein